jgi:hypothetical protein
MSKQIIYIFIYQDTIFKYNQSIRLNCNLSRYDAYKYIDSIAKYGLNRFIRDQNLDSNFAIDFIVWFERYPYYMYAERKTITSNSSSDYLFSLEPIITIMKNNKFAYNDIVIANTFRCNDFVVEDDTREFKIIDDGINKFDESHLNLLDNLPFSIEKVYLLYNITKPVNNLPFTTKKIFVYDSCDMDLIKIPFDCEVIKINPN